ncbi:cytochrome P450 [Streptomyces collinus]|uniref:cytochrome P450 n=1 Tax=Streptomyces collinus TaxID=42684 RepID=UPI00294241F8|nr:cytochrome P450 [Streptomyces collinus]
MSTTVRPPRTAAPPTVPGALPLIGHGIPLVRRRLQFLQEARAYGPLVRVRVGPTVAYLVNDPALLHQVLVTDAARFPRGIHFRKARAVAGNGIITAYGAPHRRQRKLVLPAFNRKRVQVYGDVMHEIASQRIASWPQETPIELKPEFVQLATTVGTKCLFSSELGGEAVRVVERALPILTRQVSLRAMDPTGLLEKLPTPGRRRFDETMAELNAMIQQIITAYRESEREEMDLLTMLMAATDEETGRGMDDQQLRDEIISILLSSAETTALTLSWSCYELGRAPEVQRRLQEEVDSVLDGRAPTHEDLGRLDLTRRVIRETLRLYPPTYFLSRAAARDTELGGYHVPEGSVVLYSFYSQHRDPLLFRNPARFDPDRWLPGREDDVTPEAYMPFGEGAHRCVGEGFAYAEAMTTLALIAGLWHLEPVSDRPVRPVGTVTLVPDGLRMTVRRRER